MTSRLLARRPLQLGGLLLAATTVGLATSPAALAEDLPTPQADPSADAGTPQVLPPAPTTSTTTSTTTGTDTTGGGSSVTDQSADQDGAAPQVAAANPPGAHFGTGKLNPSLNTTADPLPAGAVLAAAGAQLEIRFSQMGGAPSTASGTCDLVAPYPSSPLITDCRFRPGHSLQTQDYGAGPAPTLPADSVFTLTLVQPPTSGQLLAAPMSVQGWTDTTASPGLDSDLRLAVRHGYRALGVAVVDGAPAGTRVLLCPAVGNGCANGSTPVPATTDASGLATFDGRYLPGDYLLIRGTERTRFTVAPATTTTERDTPLLLSLGVPVTPLTPTPTPAPPTSAPGAATAASATLAVGRQQTVTAGGFTPGETVRGTLYSTPVDLGTAVADAQGVATFTFTVPAGLEVGVHTVTAVGLTSGSTSTVTFTVTAGGDAVLATTGVDVAPLLGLGALAVGAGSALAFAGTRRRRTA
ncbi:hypothetical protein SAMN03159343_0799 [Klenkia marina]|uniref:Ig-like domain (Group 3) n=1 Tax=Klenkia marina TaxID=1960309 RepID=A0A1G4XF13_9ACTN|nr:hypothetical protein [Klenkia marina]SCX39822.1 hypothetical protein SAMN03159343_0799 [Klenkia marina]